MLQKSLRGVFTSLLALSLFSAAQAADVGFEFGLGFDTSGDWRDIGKKAYGADSSGLGMFLELQAGVPIGINENVVIKTELSYLMGFVSVEYAYGEDDTYIDSILIPSVAAEYYVNGREANSFFVGANIGYPIPSSGSDGAYELEKKGVSFGIYGGYAFNGNLKVSLGYRSIPVEAVYLNGAYKESVNLGGVSFRFAYAF
jgi:opacity protein-like surface antigen